MKYCPSCNSNSKVILSRVYKNPPAIKRMRECLKCKYHWGTKEVDIATLQRGERDKLLITKFYGLIDEVLRRNVPMLKDDKWPH